MKDILLELVRKNPKRVARELHYPKYAELKKWIYENTPTPIADEKYTLPTRIYWIVNDMVDFPTCKACGKQMGEGSNIKVTVGYKELCPRCSVCSDDAVKRREETCLRKYGVRNPSMSNKIKDKIKQVNLERFGTTCALQNAEVRDKANKTILSRYGAKYYQSTDMFKEQIKSTCMERYGVDSIFKDASIRERMKQSMLKKYGVEHNLQSKEIQSASRLRMIEKYGKDYAHILWGNHGNIGQNKRAYDFISKSELVEPLFTLEEYVSGKKDNLRYEFPFKCKTCGNNFTSWWDNGKTRVCPNCFRERGTSNEENELFEFIREIYNGNIYTNSRDIIPPYEIDICVKDRNLAFEFDGLFWHNDEIHKNRRYHLMKTEECERNGIQLIHVFEDEWRTKRNIVESRIRNLFGVYENTVYARKCSIEDISYEDSKEFLMENHIQGHVRSKVSIGLKYDGDLVSLMTFGKSRFNKKYEWELLRFCNKLGYHIPGAASRLLKEFERRNSPKSIVSYSDRRWSIGKLYISLGFELVSKTEPNYWYFKSSEGILMSRMRFQKHKLKDMLTVFDENKSEVENMKENGYLRVFDCGNLVFGKTYP